MRTALATALLLLSMAAHADKPATVVVPFTGPRAKQAEGVVIRVIRKRAALIAPAAWTKAARKLAATSNSPENVSAVAEEVGARIVITGTVKRDGRAWQLVVSVRDGKSGRSHDKLKYQMKAPRLTGGTLALLAKEVDEAFDHTVTAVESGTPPDEGSAKPAKPAEKPKFAKSEKNEQSEKNELPPVRELDDPPPQPKSEDEPPPLPQNPEAQVKREAPTARPRWAPWFDLTVGASISGRSFEFDPASQPRFRSGIVGGIRTDLTLYPFAFTWKKAAGQIAGLGLGVSVDKPFWPDSTPKNDPTQKFATDELRVEGGLRWRFILLKRVPRPELTVVVGGGLHNFGIAKLPDGGDVGPSDVSYKYLTAGGGLRLHFAEWASLHVGFQYHHVFDAGAIQTVAQYGPGSAWGIRVGGGLDFFVWRGLKLGAIGFYERFVLAFTGMGNPAPMKIASSAIDQYFGGMLVVGYAY